MSPFSLAFPSFRGAVKALVLSCALLFIIQLASPETLETWLGLVPAAVWSRLEIWRIFTYMFLHGSFFHILLNMFTLWIFGSQLESEWGTREFLKFYFVCGTGAALCNVLFEPHSPYAVIGASGAIYGLLVAFAVVYPDSIIYLYGIIPMRAKAFVLLLGLFEFFASFHGTNTTIARLAHLGGMLTGYLYLKSYEFRSILSRLAHSFLETIFVRHEPAGERRAKRPRGEKDLVKEVDRILEKVLRHGADSLTDEEKEIMRRYSARRR